MLCRRGKGDDAHDDHRLPATLRLSYFSGATQDPVGSAPSGLVVNCASALMHQETEPQCVGPPIHSHVETAI